MEQRCQGTLQIWAEPFTRLRLPKVFNLRTDPSNSPTCVYDRSATLGPGAVANMGLMIVFEPLLAGLLLRHAIVSLPNRKWRARASTAALDEGTRP